MRCPKCKNLDTRVIDSRIADDNQSIRRRRECEKCGSRYTTFERMEFVNFPVTKTDGSIEMYDRSKVQRAIGKALYKRKFDEEKIEHMINELEAEWAANKKAITAKRIGKDILRKLKDFDEVAYIRFASIYHNFVDIKEFMSFIRDEFDT
jgi:transcriptional repressor NrdR